MSAGAHLKGEMLLISTLPSLSPWASATEQADPSRVHSSQTLQGADPRSVLVQLWALAAGPSTYARVQSPCMQVSANTPSVAASVAPPVSEPVLGRLIGQLRSDQAHCFSHVLYSVPCGVSI